MKKTSASALAREQLRLECCAAALAAVIKTETEELASMSVESLPLRTLLLVLALGRSDTISKFAWVQLGKRRGWIG